MDNFRITASHDGSRHFRDNGGYQNLRGPRKGNHHRGQRNRYSDRLPHGGPRRLDDDVQMDGAGPDAGASSSHSRFNPYGHRHRRDMRPRGGNRAMDSRADGVMSRLGLPVGHDLKRDGNDWYRVSIPFGKKLDKDFIIRSISSVADVPFIPIYFHFEGVEAVFYVKGGAEARAIQNTSKRITVSEGFKMVVKINRSGPPATPLNEDVTKKIKECMSKRYDVAALSLNLTDLSNDEDLKKGDVFITLRRGPVVKKILDIIGENIPDLRLLDLSKNHIQELEYFTKIEDRAPKLQQLNLAQNQIRLERELHVFAKLSLEEICLDGNPLCDRFTDRTTYISVFAERGTRSNLAPFASRWPPLTPIAMGLHYIASVFSAIRKRFPKVLKLDGNVLPPPITFDVDASTTLPSPKGSFFANDHVQELIARFAEQYFALYDSDNRQPLIDAYHEQAVFSVSYYSWSGSSGKQASMSEYHMKSRNLARTKDYVQRQHRLKTGRVNVIALLSELPATQHDPTSFTVDVGVASTTLLSFTVHGLFKEVSKKTDKDVIRQFSRNFVAVPNGPGVALTSDMLFVCDASLETAKKYFKAPAAMAPVSQVSSVAQIISPAVGLTATTVVTPEMRQQMILAFSVQSGMNERYSAMCLEQNNWDYDKAAAVFTDMKQKNSVPPEAFIK